ncbi:MULTISPECIES: hypothetical protein [unclassified Lebetimonas]|uniref:hypothetical protein n=1 Tax=unclassified Lebetimonas TaxID=2648158 RepID=UPI000464C60B|nr:MULTISPECIES: hypothetical protein [unclassified Lebetimonas]
MIREIVKPDKEKLIIHIPKEYIGKEIEILIFPKNENKNDLEEFKQITKKRVKPKVSYYKGMENEVNNDLF